MNWRILLRPVTLSASAVGWCLAALVGAVAITALRGAVPLEALAGLHWALILGALVCFGFFAPFLAFAGRATWQAFSLNPRPWLVAALEVAITLWVVAWAAWAVAGKLGIVLE